MNSIENIPTRVQRTRVKGAKLPPNTICVTRPGKYSNPFKIGETVSQYDEEVFITPEICLEWFEDYARGMLVAFPNWLDPLRAADHIACWCKVSNPCHGDVLIKLLAESSK